MKLIKGVCLGKKHAEIEFLFLLLKKQRDNIHRKRWVCYHGKKKYWLVCLPTKLNSWRVTKKYARKKPAPSSHSIEGISWESSELDCLFCDSEMCQIMLEMDQEYSLHSVQKNVLVSAAAVEVLHWQRLVLKDRSLDNVLVYSSICIATELHF